MLDITAVLQEARVIPVLREDTPEKALESARRLHEAGFTCVEITTSAPDWSQVITSLHRELPGLTTAAGTIMTTEQVEGAVAAGAAFLVSPHAAPDARLAAERAGVPFIEGGLTPGEVAAAARWGPAKLFPAHLGGPKYLRDLLSVMPDAQIMPTGGITPESVDAWLDAGALAIGIGSALAHRTDLADLADRILRLNRTRETA